MAKAKKKEEQVKEVKVELQALDIRVLKLTLVGDSPLIVKRFSEKTRDAIGEKQGGENARPTKKPRVKQEEYEDAKYRTEDGRDGIPASGIKNAMITACTSTNKGVYKTFITQAVHVMGGVIPLRASNPYLREDSGRNPTTKKGCVIYRPCYEKWEVDVSIRYNASIITPSLIVNMLDLAGFGVGLHEWRPEKKGTFGTFHVKKENEKTAKTRKAA